MKVEEYLKGNGSSSYQEWFDGLDAQATAKVTVAKVAKFRQIGRAHV